MQVRKSVICTALIAVILLTTVPVFAQNLRDNAEMRQAREYERLAEQAMDEGDYEEAIEYSELAAEYARRGQETAERTALGFRANSLLNRASSRLYYTQRIGVPNRDPDTYQEARATFQDAEQFLANDEFQNSIDKSLQVLSLLEGFEPRRFVASRDDAPDPAGDKPEHYIVRLIPERRDSFWRIAEYDFVYGDPWLWPRLYEQNKHILQDPDNPHLIQPGMMFEIPSRDGEVRSGVWNPQDAIEN